MFSQVRFVMHPADEREFEQLVIRDVSIRFIAGPRWKTETPTTSTTLADIVDCYCIIWTTSDLAELKSEYIPTCDDWYCRSEYATIQFLRSEMDDAVLTEGRIAIATTTHCDLSASSLKSLENRYKHFQKYFRKNYENSIVQWRNPTVPYAPAGPNRSANPSKPDAQLWVGPHALRWLRELPDRRIKQFRHGKVEAVLVAVVG
ncbi:MAG: hypothetical protein ABI557_14725 [Aureliella sp.]